MKKQLAALGVAASLLTLSGLARADSELVAGLSGADEVPPVATSAFGLARFDLNFTGSTLGINYELTAVNLPQAFMAHIHCGAAGANGPIAVWLAGSPGAPAGSGYDVNGTWIGNARFDGGNVVPGNGCGDTLEELLSPLFSGGMYVNIHTAANPGGELRGQIAPTGALTVP